MLANLLKEYWHLIVISGLLIVVYNLNNSLDESKINLSKCQVKSSIQNDAIQDNSTDLAANEKIVVKTVEKVRTEFKDRVQVIYETGEKNETCETAMDNLNRYTY